ncbi:MAG TPA: phage head closure protein [Candidatus Desulfobacillus denitrificans]|nr:phage head closure protein [Candidatus Desulfobacillus denitrificans]
MRAGLLDQRVALQAKSVSRAANGEEVVTWTTEATFWAQVQQLRGKEYYAGGQMQDAVDVKVRARWRSDVAREKRLLWGAVPLDIVSVIEVGARKGWLEIMCLAGARNAHG